MAVATVEHLRTAIIEALTTDRTATKTRALPANRLFQVGLPPGLPADKRSTYSLPEPGAFVAIARMLPEPGVADELGSDHLYRLGIVISRDYHIGLPSDVADVQRAFTRIADDFMRLRAALCFPGALDATAAGDETGIADNGLESTGAETQIRFEEIGANRGRLLNARDTFTCRFLFDPNPLTMPGSGIVAWWELRDSALSSGEVTGLADRTDAGNDLSPLDFGSGEAITLAVDADYGRMKVGTVPGGGEVLIRGNFAAPLTQPYTVLWLGEWTGSDDGAAYDGADDSATLYRESGEGFVSAGTPASVGAIADDTPYAALTIFNGAATKHYSGSDWSTPLTVDAGAGSLDGWLFAAGNGGTRARAGKDDLAAVWSRALSSDEIAEAVAYLNANHGTAITT